MIHLQAWSISNRKEIDGRHVNGIKKVVSAVDIGHLRIHLNNDQLLTVATVVVTGQQNEF